MPKGHQFLCPVPQMLLSRVPRSVDPDLPHVARQIQQSRAGISAQRWVFLAPQ